MSGQEIVDLTKKHTLFEWSAQSKVDPIPVARAKGIYFWTPEGKRFIDFNSQLMSVNIGHGDERVIQAITEQAQTLAYANPFMATEPRARLGAKLAEITPGDIDTFFFTNGGAEANENAIKIARFFTGRHKIMARYRSYHGATAGAVSLTGDPRRWAAEPGIPGVVRVLDPYHGIERGWESAETSLAMIEETMQLEGPQTIAEQFQRYLAEYANYNYFFIHYKYTDMHGEDGNFAAKTKAIEGFDAALPILLEKTPDVLVITGDHSTPCAVKGHSWHPQPVLLTSAISGSDKLERFSETAANSGSLGVFEAKYLVRLMQANAKMFDKFGA